MSWFDRIADLLALSRTRVLPIKVEERRASTGVKEHVAWLWRGWVVMPPKGVEIVLDDLP